MERILKILVISIFAFLLILWISTVFNTCNNKKTDDNIQTEMLEDSLDGSDEVDLTEDIFEDDSTASVAAESLAGSSDGTKAKSKEENIDDYIDYTGDVDEKKTKSSVQTKKPKAETTKQTASAGGKYLVVAGSFLDKRNAEAMKKRLYDLGYDSEIVNFDLSQYYSVLAGRYYSRKEAQNTVTILKRNGIDSYVHRKK